MSTLFEQAVLHENAGEYRKANELFLRCLSAEGPGHTEAAFHCGWCLEHDPTGDRAQVLRYYEQATTDAAPVIIRANAFFRIGWILMQDKEFEKAAEALKGSAAISGKLDQGLDLFHQALFWHAVCLEHQGRYIETAEHYAMVQRLSATLAPEAGYREVVCHTLVGRFEDALRVCREFPAQAPAGFDPQRFAELRTLVTREHDLLVKCLAEG